MRRHPVVGTLFLFAGFILFAIGAVAPAGRLPRAPVPLEVVVPFVLWQFAVWATLLGISFLRPRRAPPQTAASATKPLAP